MFSHFWICFSLSPVCFSIRLFCEWLLLIMQNSTQGSSSQRSLHWSWYLKSAFTTTIELFPFFSTVLITIWNYLIFSCLFLTYPSTLAARLLDCKSREFICFAQHMRELLSKIRCLIIIITNSVLAPKPGTQCPHCFMCIIIIFIPHNNPVS